MGGGVGVEPRLSPKARFNSADRSEAVKSNLLNLPLSGTMVLQLDFGEKYCNLNFNPLLPGCDRASISIHVRISRGWWRHWSVC